MTSILGGQPDSDEMVFQPPIVAPDNATRPNNSSPFPKHPPSKNALVGKANVTQNGTKHNASAMTEELANTRR